RRAPASWRRPICASSGEANPTGRRTMFTSIAGRAVVVTGSSKGIGKGIARVFASKGARVLVVARDGKAAQKAADEIKAAGGKAAALVADGTKWDDMQRMAEAAAKEHGGVDVLCGKPRRFPAAQPADT